MNHTEFFTNLKAGKIENVYFFRGDEEFIRRKALGDLQKKLLMPGLEALNVSVLQDPKAQEIIESCETLPMMGDWRIVIAEDSHLLAASSSDSDKEKKGKEKQQSDADKQETEDLCAYLKRIPPTTCLVFNCTAKPDLRKKLAAVLSKMPGSVSFDPLDDSDLYKWINQTLRRSGKTMERPVCEQLAFTSGRSLELLTKELEKLAAYAGDRTEITAGDVEQCATHTSECTVFAMVDAISEKKTAEAFRLLDLLLTSGEQRIGILALLTRHYRQLTYLCALTDAGKSGAEILQIMNIKPFVRDKLRRQMGKRNSQELQRLLAACTNTEYAIKSGRFGEEAGLERLLFLLSA